MVKVTIDGREMEFAEGTSLFDACREARGEPLPHFCYHPDLPVAGVCRLCQVEVEGMPKLTIACNTTVRPDMVVHTRSEKVRKAAQQILELHLINHPVDCPICDQAGECGLQDQYMAYGLYESEVEKDDKVHKAKAQVIGPHVILDKERCVLCSRCVRFCEHVTGTAELGIFNRGDRAEIGIAPGRELGNNYSLNTVDICPVGALTSRDFRFKKRVWLLRGTPSICPGCSRGCNIRIDHEAERIYRLKPRFNEAVNGRWMCDLGRLEYRAIGAEDRLDMPLLIDGGESREADWDRVWARLGELGEPALVLVSPWQTLEEMALAADLAPPDALVSGPAEAARGEADELLLTADRAPNRRGLALVGADELPADRLAALCGAAEGPIVIIGGDPAGASEAVAAALASRTVIYLGTHRNATSRLAQVVVPTSAWAERDGIWVNGDGRLQGIRRAVARPGEAREDWRFLSDWRESLTGLAPPDGLPALRRAVAERVAALDGVDLNTLGTTGTALAGTGAGGEA